MSLLLAAPTPREARAIGQGCRVTGAGEAAAEALAAMLREERPDAVLVAGLCGGLDPSLRAGTLILAREAIDEDGDGLQPPAATLAGARRALRSAGPRFVCSRLVTVRAPVSTRAARRDLWNAHGAAGADMETVALARVAAEHGVGWMALRAVIDPADMALPRALRGWRGPADERALLRELALSPRDWPACARLALALRPSLRALRTGARIVARAARDTVPLDDGLLAPTP